LNNVTRTVLLGAALGTGVASALTIPMWIPAVLASEPVQVITEAAQTAFEPAPLFEADDFVKMTDGGVRYTARADGTVSTEVSGTQTVKKIGFGEVSTVTIVTTPTGVYSSDAIFSPNVRYPGISVTAEPTFAGVLRDLEKIEGLSVPIYDGSFVVLIVGT
jgi:hypothetical protein